MSVNQFEEMKHAEEPFSEFEQELKRAMCGVYPPEGFAERTIARTQASAPLRRKILTMKLSPRVWASGAMAAALLVGVFCAEEAHLRHQRVEAELARRQFEVAMRITDRTLQHVRQQLWDAGVRADNQ
jgi:hypothetical protein